MKTKCPKCRKRGKLYYLKDGRIKCSLCRKCSTNAIIDGSPSKKERGTNKQRAFGILCRSGEVWAEVVAKTESKNLGY